MLPWNDCLHFDFPLSPTMTSIDFSGTVRLSWIAIEIQKEIQQMRSIRVGILVLTGSELQLVRMAAYAHAHMTTYPTYQPSMSSVYSKSWNSTSQRMSWRILFTRMAADSHFLRPPFARALLLLFNKSIIDLAKIRSQWPSDIQQIRLMPG